MEVRIDGRDGGIGCWNAEAINAYAADVDATEARLAGTPDLVVIPGKIACQGCVVNAFGRGTFCTAQLTETQVAVRGQRAPLPEAAHREASVIPGYEMIKPGSGAWAEGYEAPAEQAPVMVPEPSPRRGGIGRLFRR